MQSRKGATVSLKSLINNNRVQQVGVLYLSLLASLALGIAVSVINTRLLGPQAFGDFKFLQTIWTVGVAFVTFGLFTTGGNLLARKASALSEQPLIGSLLVIACVIAVFFTVSMVALSFPVGFVYRQELGSKMRLFSALVFIFPLQIYIQEVLRAINDITSLAILNALPQLIYILMALATDQFIGFSLDIALLLYLLGMVMTVTTIIFRAKPSFDCLRQGFQEIFEGNRAIGLPIYVAILLTTVSTQLSQFSLAYFCDTRLVGIFSLAVTITMPLTMIPNAISTTFFKQFALQDQIPGKIIWATWGISLTTLLVFLAVIRMIIVRLYTAQYIDVVPLAYICAFGATVHGVGDVYNRFLLAKGRTRVLRTNAFHLALIGLVGYMLLVAWWGAVGAALTKITVDVVYLTSMFIYYKKSMFNHDII